MAMDLEWAYMLKQVKRPVKCPAPVSATQGPYHVTFNSELKIVQVNVNGYASRRSQLRSFIENIGECIILINDTRFKERSRNTDLPGYSFIRQDRKYSDNITTAGGVAVAVPQKWVSHRVDYKFKSERFLKKTLVFRRP